MEMRVFFKDKIYLPPRVNPTKHFFRQQSKFPFAIVKLAFLLHIEKIQMIIKSPSLTPKTEIHGAKIFF